MDLIDTILNFAKKTCTLNSIDRLLTTVSIKHEFDKSIGTRRGLRVNPIQIYASNGQIRPHVSRVILSIVSLI